MEFKPESKKPRKKIEFVEYWETQKLPSFQKTSSEFLVWLKERYKQKDLIDRILNNPYLDRELQEQIQLERIKYLVSLAYEKVPLYRRKYREAGFEPGDLKTWEDYYRLPIITKDDFLSVPPREYVNSDFNLDNLFKTRSSGTSGKVLPIYVDSEAIIIDTLQGIRQFYLQSEGKYSKEDILVNIYTVPWWVDSIEGDYQTVFISSLISPEKIAQILRDIQPEIISLYPSNLKSLLPYLVDQQIKRNLYLIVVHSEMSSREERRLYSDIIGVPVLDEYSSEELTRIALELPCGHYHICEDTVRLDVLDPDTLKPINKGTGLAVATNLLNIAMPFIRYFQGDYISVEEEKKCNINWRQIEKVEGRVNDSFLTKYGKEIPAGTLLDITYRMMFDTGINIKEFSLIQKDYNLVLLKIYDPELQNSQEKIDLLVKKLKELLSTTFGYSVEVNLEFSESPLIKLGVSKRRVIVRDLQNK